MRLVLFPTYTETGASSRYRIYQYIPCFKQYNTKVYPFFDENYIPGQNLKSIKGILYLFKIYLGRLYRMACLQKDDVVILQYEFTKLLPFNTLFFKIFRIKYIVDFDDAVFHDYDCNKNRIIRTLFKNKIAHVIKHAKIVITGSPYLTDYASRFNPNIIEIPTSIDLKKYKRSLQEKNNDKFVIGWIGSSSTSLHLRLIVDALKVLHDENINFELKLIGYDSKEGINFGTIPLKMVKWEASTEISELATIDVGIMPLIDFPFARGKCAFKLIQYMAMAKPTISSSFEANLKVDINKENLFADTTENWVNAFKEIIDNRGFYKQIGLRNRKIIENYYCIQSNAEKYVNIIESVKNVR
ncbi:glycosyltransferase family 4 protein [Seonamhaeicola sediminis]|uniref:Glycosyltransferase family 4 protein n=1 Tax=Seonamhaeicola sediminis TaxID=2528206 RepID=A0A562YGM2_9FLAO|nr:glycosyltransferase [Seonamhaeicola sediminis]TWO33980.1 glycosyltransferase family 4 protein [Seonamhaeicola sediminis]